MNLNILQANAGRLPLKADSVHCVVTSPPYYALRRYNAPDVPYGAWRGQLGLEPTPELFIEHMVGVFREVKRVLRGDGVAFVNMGDSYAGNPGNGRGGGSKLDGGDPHLSGSDKRSLPAKNLLLIPQRLAIALQQDGWWVRSFFPWLKCLSGGTRVYAKTQKGEMPTTIKDLVRLDPSTVKLWNGEKWTQVLGWQETPRGKNNIEIHLRSGERIGSTPTHQWPTQRGLVEAKDLRLGDVVDFVRLPEPKDTSSPSHIPDDFAWILGLYLAEGNKYKDSISLACNIKKVDFFEKLSRFANCYDANCASHQTSEGGVTYSIYSKVVRGIVDTYINGSVARDKHLSAKCWARSDQFLQNLLMGYLEGDGHYDKKNDRWRLCFTKNDNLANDLRTLCARLGISFRLKRGTAPYNGERVKVWRGQIRFNPPVKNNRPTAFQRKPDTEIVKIETSRARKFWDIAVEDEPHLFALASGVLTHNSNAMPESVQDRPSTAHEYIIMLTKSARYFYDADAVRVGHKEPWRSTGASEGHKKGSGNTFTASASRKKDGFGDYVRKHGRNYNPAGRNRRTTDAWNESIDAAIHCHRYEIDRLEALRDSDLPHDDNNLPMALQVNPRAYPGAHYATFPPALVEPFIKAATSERGVCSVCGAQWQRVGTLPHSVLGNVLKSIREERGFNIAELADLVGVGSNNIWDWESGGHIPSETSWSKLSAALDLPVNRETFVQNPEYITTGNQAGFKQQAGEKDCFVNAPYKQRKVRVDKPSIDFSPTCNCPDHTPVPATVLDIFGGTGVTALVANALGRRGITTEISPEYVELAKERTAFNAWQAWRRGKKAGAGGGWEGTMFEGT
jgi:DNA modification methylase/transcriptional regulator with XRE-family HTH domain